MLSGQGAIYWGGNSEPSAGWGILRLLGSAISLERKIIKTARSVK